MNGHHLRISRQQQHFVATTGSRLVSDSFRIVFLVLFFYFTPRTTFAIQLTSDNNDSDCVDLRMIMAFEDRPIDVTINLHTASAIDANNQPQQYYWENYIPYDRRNVSTTTLL